MDTDSALRENEKLRNENASLRLRLASYEAAKDAVADLVKEHPELSPTSANSSFYSGLYEASMADIRDVLRAALTLERLMYSGGDTGKALFRLRKALEGIWGHDLPEV